MLTPQPLVTQTTGLSVPPFYIFVVIIVLALARITWRTLANYRGTAFSLGRTVIYACVYVGLGVFFSSLSYFEGVSYWLAVPEAILAGSAALWSYKYTDKRISFWNSPEGQLYFRGGVVIYLIYLAGFVARFSIDIAFVGPSMFSFASGVTLIGAALYGSMATDLLLTLGVGLLLGRNIRVVRRFRMIQRGEEAVPDSNVVVTIPGVESS